jgi:hypothetical protein
MTKCFLPLIVLSVLMAAPVALADAPTTLITAGPNGDSYQTSPQFEFSSSAPGSTFECKLDSGGFTPCMSPLTLSPLEFGEHTFSVRAIDPEGQTDPAPPTRSWRVVPPITTPLVRLAAPSGRAVARSAFRRISGTAKAASGVTRIQVTLQRGGPDKSVFPPRCTYFDMRSATKTLQACVLPAYFKASGTTNWHYNVTKAGRSVLAPGKYTLIVRAFNAYGQASQTRFPLTLR